MVEVSLGELLDKISILRIKLDKIKDSDKLVHIAKEERVLTESAKALNLDGWEEWVDKMIAVNSQLWVIEDDIREQEKAKTFADKFVELARSVYVINDERFAIKGQINENYGSEIQEMKSYEDYS